jgi:hypothetical protein
MYADVAERTTVGSEPEDRVLAVAPSTAPGRSGRRQILAAAVVLVLVVGGLLVLANREVERPAGRDAPTRILPGWVPRFTTPDGGFEPRPLALTELRSDAERDRITYANAVGSITVELDRTRGVPSDGEPVIVRGGPARRTESTLSWLGPDNAVVEVSWSGAVDDAMIDLFVRTLAYVNDDVWIEAAGTGGFRRAFRDPLTTVEIDAATPFAVDIVGDLHEGLQLQVGTSGFLALGVSRCSASFTDETSDPESNATGYVILAPGDVGSVVVSTDHDEDRLVDVTSLLPLADVSIGGVVYENRTASAPLPRVDCGEAP